MSDSLDFEIKGPFDNLRGRVLSPEEEDYYGLPTLMPENKRLEHEYKKVIGNNPDNVGRKLSAASKLGVPGFMAELPEYSEEFRKKELLLENGQPDWNTQAVDFPRTSDFLLNGRNMQFAHDDIAELNALEDSANRMKISNKIYNGVKKTYAKVHPENERPWDEVEEKAFWNDMSDKYNTVLTEAEEAGFHAWLEDQTVKMGRDVSLDLKNTDLRGYYKELLANEGDIKDGMADKYMKPNNPLFSDRSIYNGIDGYLGGQYKEFTHTKYFIPGKANLTNRSEAELNKILDENGINHSAFENMCVFAGDSLYSGFMQSYLGDKAYTLLQDAKKTGVLDEKRYKEITDELTGIQNNQYSRTGSLLSRVFYGAGKIAGQIAYSTPEAALFTSLAMVSVGALAAFAGVPLVATGMIGSGILAGTGMTLASSTAGMSMAEIQAALRVYSTWNSTRRTEAGLDFVDRVNLTNAEGEKINVRDAANASEYVGFVNGILETMEIEAVGSPIGKLLGNSKSWQSFGGRVITKFINTPSFKRTLALWSKDIITNDAFESFTEVLQDLTPIIADEMQKEMLLDGHGRRDINDIASQLADTFGQSFVEFALVSAFGPTVQGMGGYYRGPVTEAARKKMQVEHTNAMLDDFRAKSVISKSLKRNPESTGEHTQRLLQHAHIPNVYMNKETLDNLYKNGGFNEQYATLEDFAYDVLGVTAEEIAEADKNGTDLTIATSNYVNNLSEEQIMLVESDIRYRSDGMTMNEAADFNAKINLAKNSELFAIDQNEEKAQAERESIHQIAELKQQELINLGIDREVAHHDARVISTIYGTLTRVYNKLNGTELTPMQYAELNPMSFAIDKGTITFKNNRLPQTVFHGSPQIFEGPFSTKHIGEGEGAQAYGWGLYFASDKEVAEWYRNKLTEKKINRIDFFRSLNFNGLTFRELEYKIEHEQYELEKQIKEKYGNDPDKISKSEEGKRQKFVQELISLITTLSVYNYDFRQFNEILEATGKNVSEEALSWFKTNVIDIAEEEWKKTGIGALYQVEIPDDNETNYLYWDKDVSLEIRKKIANLLKKKNFIEGEWLYKKSIIGIVRGKAEKAGIGSNYSKGYELLEDLKRIARKEFEKRYGKIEDVVDSERDDIKPITLEEAIELYKKDIEKNIAYSHFSIKMCEKFIAEDRELLEKVKKSPESQKKTEKIEDLEQDIRIHEHMLSARKEDLEVNYPAQLSFLEETMKNGDLTVGKITAGKITKVADKTGMGIYDWLSSEVFGNNNRLASLFLKEAGVVGIKYLDGNSRGRGEGHYNYVIFDDSDITDKQRLYQDFFIPSEFSERADKLFLKYDDGMYSLSLRDYVTEKSEENMREKASAEREAQIEELLNDRDKLVSFLADYDEVENLAAEEGLSVEEYLASFDHDKLSAFMGEEETEIDYSSREYHDENSRVYIEALRKFEKYYKDLTDLYTDFMESMGYKLVDTDESRQSESRYLSFVPADKVDADGDYNPDDVVEVRMSAHTDYHYNEGRINLFSDESIKDNLAKLQKFAYSKDGALYQSRQKSGVYRGYIDLANSFGKGEETKIVITPEADASTVIHESAHFYFAQLRQMGQFGPVEDLEKVWKWWGHNAKDIARQASTDKLNITEEKVKLWLRDAEAVTDAEARAIDVAAQEYFARGFEAYLREGKAPSEETQSLFRRFKQWLIGIYKSMAELDVHLSPEITEVFDRMVASEEAIDAYKADMEVAEKLAQEDPLFGTDVFDDVIDEHLETAKETLLSRSLQDLTPEEKEKLEKEKEEVRDRITRNVHSLRGYQNIQKMREAGFKISEYEIIDTYGEAVLDRIPKDITSPDGQSLDWMRRNYGYNNVEDFMEDLLRVPVDPEAEIERQVEHEMQHKQRSLATAERFGVEAESAAYEDEHYAENMMDATVNMPFEDSPSQELLDRTFEEGMQKGLEEGEKIHKEQMEAERKLQRDRQANFDKEVREKKAVVKNQSLDSIRRSSRDITNNMSLEELESMRVLNKYRTAERGNLAKAIDFLSHGNENKFKQYMFRHIAAHETIRYIYQKRAEVEKMRDRLKKYARRGKKTLGMSVPYLKQMDVLLAHFDWSENRSSAERHSVMPFEMPINILDAEGNAIPNLKTFIKLQEAEGTAFIAPDWIMDLEHKRHYSMLTFEEFTDLYNTAVNLRHNGSEDRKTIALANNLRIDDIAEQIYNRCLSYFGTTSKEILVRQQKDKINTLDDVMPSIETAEGIMRFFDGYKDDGPLQRYVFRPIREACSRETVEINTIYGKLQVLREKCYGKDYTFDPREIEIDVPVYARVPDPEVEGRYIMKATTEKQRFTKAQLVCAVLNMGNEGNIQRMQAGWGYSDRDMNVILSYMTKEDMDYIQGIWDILDEMFPKVQKVCEIMTGCTLKKVEAKPLKTQHGTYRGGYYPIVTDRRYSGTAAARAELKEISASQPLSFAQTHTQSGQRKERVISVSGQPPLLSFDVLDHHIINTVHDYHLAPAVRDARKILRNDKVQQSIRTSVKNGERYNRMLNMWLNDVASNKRNNAVCLDGTNGIINKAKYGSAMFNLSFNIVGMLKQTMGFLPLAHRLGSVNMVRAIKKLMTSYVFHHKDFISEINEKSVYMKSEMEGNSSIIRDLQDTLTWKTNIDSKLLKVAQKFGLTQKQIAELGFSGYAMMQNTVNYSGWWVAYEKGLKEYGNEADAVAYADSVIRQTQGSSAMVDRNMLEKGNLGSLVCMYYTWFRVMYQMQTEAFRKVKYEKGFKNRFGALASHTFYNIIMMQIMESMIENMLRGDNDDDEDKKSSWVKQTLARTIAGFGSAVPVVRDITDRLTNNMSYRVSPVESSIESVVKLFSAFGDYLYRGKDFKSVAEKTGDIGLKAAGEWTGFPNRVMLRIGRVFWDYFKEDESIPWQWMFFGGKKPESKHR